MVRATSVGIAVAIVAAIATTMVVLATVRGQADPPKRPPVDALQPDQITKIPPGTTLAQGAASPTDYGGFRILPQHAVPQKCSAPGPAASGRGKVDVAESTSPAAFLDHDLRQIPPYTPKGWAITEVHAETINWPDGSSTDTLFALQYERDRHFPIVITRLAVEGACQVELVAHPVDSNETYTLGVVAGREAVIQHQAPGRGAQVSLEVYVRDGMVLTIVQGRAIDIDELIKTAESIQEGTP